MSNWKTITVDDLKNTKAATLIERLGEVGLGEDQDDPTGEIIANVTARIRAEIAGCAENTLDSDTSKIPNDLVSLACRMVYKEMAARVRISLTQDERDQDRADVRYLERIAACDVPVADPDDPDESPEVSQGASAPYMNDRTQNFSRDKQDGI